MSNPSRAEYDEAVERLIAKGYVFRTMDEKGALAFGLTPKGRELSEQIGLTRRPLGGPR